MLVIPDHFLEEEEREGFDVSDQMKRYREKKIKMLSAVNEICVSNGNKNYV